MVIDRFIVLFNHFLWPKDSSSKYRKNQVTFLPNDQATLNVLEFFGSILKANNVAVG